MNIDANKTRKWVKVIALWMLCQAVLNTIFYLLIQLSVIDEALSTIDHIDFFVSTSFNAAIFLGLWQYRTWGWKTAILFIPLVWIYNISHLLIDYERGMGILYSLLALIDALILQFMFKYKVRKLFSLDYTTWVKLRWTVTALFVLTVFLLLNDLFNDIIAVVFAFALVLGVRTANRYKKKLKAS